MKVEVIAFLLKQQLKSGKSLDCEIEYYNGIFVKIVRSAYTGRQGISYILQAQLQLDKGIKP